MRSTREKWHGLTVKQAAICMCQMSTCLPRFLYSSQAEGGQQSSFNSSLENAFAAKNNQERKHKIFLNNITKSEHQQQSGSIPGAQKRPRRRLQPGSVPLCSSVVYFGIHGHSHGWPAGAANAISCYGYRSCL